MNFIALTSSSNGNKISFNVDKIVGMVDHTQTMGDTIETSSFVWLNGMQEPFGVKESVETIINLMKSFEGVKSYENSFS